MSLKGTNSVIGACLGQYTKSYSTPIVALLYYSNTLFDLRKVDFGMYAKCIDSKINSFNWAKHLIVKIDNLGNEIYEMIFGPSIPASSYTIYAFTQSINHFYFTCKIMEFEQILCGGVNKASTPFTAFTQKSYGLTYIASTATTNFPVTLVTTSAPNFGISSDYTTITGIVSLETGTSASSALESEFQQ